MAFSEATVIAVWIFVRNLLLGGLSGAISKTVVAPLERIKLLLQLQDSSVQMLNANKKYKGIVHCTKNVYQEQGFWSFWRGNWANVVRYFPAQAINLACKDYYKTIFLAGVDRTKQFWRYFGGNVAAGSAAGATSLCFVYPLDFARTRLATDVGENKETREFSGLWNCLVKIWRSDGFLGLYRGFFISLIGAVLYRGAYFGLYDTAKEMIGDENLNVFTRWMVAQTTTTIAGLLTYPTDTVRRRMMMQSGNSKSERMYKNTFHCVSTMYRDEGLLSFYKGGLTNVLRGLSSALVLVLYDKLKSLAEQF